jgi:hypothetical protein
MSASEGSPIANVLLLNSAKQDSPLSVMACKFLTIAGFSVRPPPCGKAAEPSANEIANFKSLGKRRGERIVASLGSSYGYYKKNLCDGLSGAFDHDMVCDDIISVAADYCKLKTTAGRYRAVAGVDVCITDRLREIRAYVASVYSEHLKQPILEVKGNQ